MDFLKFKWLYFTISGICVLASISAIIIWGLNLSIDFTGGSLLEYQLQESISNDQIASIVHESTELQVASVQPTEQNRVILKLAPLTQEQANQIRQALSEQTGQEILELRFETLGPTLGRELLIKTLWASGLATIFILGYLAWTFKNLKFGVTAILAMLHDTIILIGVFALLGHFYGVEVDTLFVTAVLTTLSFSVHDTVVVFDRIRETQHQSPKVAFTHIANKALTETMTRSLNNSFTIVFMLSALTLLGGSTIQWFSLALLVGTVAGTYSSPFVAVPLLHTWYTWQSKSKSSKKV